MHLSEYNRVYYYITLKNGMISDALPLAVMSPFQKRNIYIYVVIFADSPIIYRK